MLTGIAIAATHDEVERLCAELEKLQELFLGIGLVTHNVNVADTRLFAFVYIELNAHAVTWQLLNFNFDRSSVAAAGGVHILNALTNNL